MNRFFKTISVFLIIGFFSITFSKLTGLTSCLIKLVAGLPCPSCGITRAVTYFLSGNILESFKYHPLALVLAMIPFINWIITKREHLTKIYATITALFIITYIFRMVYLFPHIEPMTFYNNAIAIKLLRLVFEIPYF